MQTRVGYAGGPEPEPTYHQIGGHAEAVRVTFDPKILSLEALLAQYLRQARGGGRAFGQYRSEVFPTSRAQRDRVVQAAKRAEIPVAEPETPEAIFWDAEDDHQKYRLRQDSGLVMKLAEVLGPRWDEHVYATKLNGAHESKARLGPWLDQMTGDLVRTFEKS